MSKNYNEKTRVQMPAMVHLTRLGYKYIGKLYAENAGESFDSDTNILIDSFHSAFARLNPDKKDKWLSVFDDIKKELSDDDLGKQFYAWLVSVSSYTLVDFENPLNNILNRRQLDCLSALKIMLCDFYFFSKICKYSTVESALLNLLASALNL